MTFPEFNEIAKATKSAALQEAAEREARRLEDDIEMYEAKARGWITDHNTGATFLLKDFTTEAGPVYTEGTFYRWGGSCLKRSRWRRWSLTSL